MSVKTSPETAPEYAIHRDNVAVTDVITSVTKSQGCNASMYSYVHVQVIPSALANPNVEVWWWSDQAETYIHEHVPITKTGVGAGIPYEFTIEPRGRIFFVQITLAAGSVSVMVSGFELQQFS